MIPLRDNIPSQRFPIVTVGIIIVNVLVFLSQATLPARAAARFVYAYGLIPLEITRYFYGLAERSGIVDFNGLSSGGAGGPHPLALHALPAYATILTSMFVHGGLFHIAGNMLYLWIFGDNVEDRMGRLRFVIFYLLSGLAAAAAQILSNPFSRVPMIGASGAISGVLGAYLVLFPHARVVTLIFLGFFIRLVEIPALVVLGFWIVVQIVNGVFTPAEEMGGVAWFAHIGGFVAGLLMVMPLKRRYAQSSWRERLS